MKISLILMASILTNAAFAAEDVTVKATCTLYLKDQEPISETQNLLNAEDVAIFELKREGYVCFGALGTEYNPEPGVLAMALTIPTGDKIEHSSYPRAPMARLVHRKAVSDENEKNNTCECRLD